MQLEEQIMVVDDHMLDFTRIGQLEWMLCTDEIFARFVFKIHLGGISHIATTPHIWWDESLYMLKSKSIICASLARWDQIGPYRG